MDTMWRGLPLDLCTECIVLYLTVVCWIQCGVVCPLDLRAECIVLYLTVEC